MEASKLLKNKLLRTTTCNYYYYNIMYEVYCYPPGIKNHEKKKLFLRRTTHTYYVFFILLIASFRQLSRVVWAGFRANFSLSLPTWTVTYHGNSFTTQLHVHNNCQSYIIICLYYNED